MTTVPEIFGSMVFDSRVMKARLSGEVYHSLKHTIQKGAKLDLSVANAVADAMKDWAVENGVTHFTHWFQPLTGITAEKHDSFITPAPDGALPLRHAVTPPGIPPAMPSSREKRFVSLPHFAPMAGRRWIRKHPFCAAWRR